MTNIVAIPAQIQIENWPQAATAIAFLFCVLAGALGTLRCFYKLQVLVKASTREDQPSPEPESWESDDIGSGVQGPRSGMTNCAQGASWASPATDARTLEWIIQNCMIVVPPETEPMMYDRATLARAMMDSLTQSKEVVEGSGV